MRRVVVLLGLGFLLLACTPGPEKVCTHFDTLDRADPMPRYGDTPKRERPSKKTACMNTLLELQVKDPSAYSVVAKCIAKATTSKDAWNCWVLNHISDKQPDKKKLLVACDQSCSEEKDACEQKCVAANAECISTCHMRYEDCTGLCQFAE
jgi:hypothetical protein